MEHIFECAFKANGFHFLMMFKEILAILSFADFKELDLEH